MSQDANANGHTADEPGDDRSPEEIRASIEHTREELGDTVEALAAKTDVKAQAKGRVDELKHAAEDKRDELKHAAEDTRDALRAKLPGHGSGAAQGEPGGGAPRPAPANPASGPSLADRARERRTPLIVAGSLTAAFLLGRVTGRR